MLCLKVGQIATAAMESLKEQIGAAVRAVLNPAALYWKNDSAARELEQLPRVTEAAFGVVPEALTVSESGLTFAVNPALSSTPSRLNVLNPASVNVTL